MKQFRQMKNMVLFFLLAVFAITLSVQGVNANSPNYDILSVEVNDMLAYSSTGANVVNILDVERGDTINIEVMVEGDANISSGVIDDVFVEAKIVGYEYGSISATEGPFSIEAGNTYHKMLTIQIPQDIDSSESYTLRVEVSDSIDEEQINFNLHIDEQRHSLNIFDVLLNPSSTISAGNPLFVSARLENLGEKKEEDIKVTVSIPALGISAVNYVDELVTQIQEAQEQFKENEESSRQIDLLLRIPGDAQSGTYEVRVDVEYDRGHSFISESLSLNVVGTEQEEQGVQTIVNSDSISKSGKTGEEVAYKIMIANLGEESALYSVQIDGVSTWGAVSVDPGFLTVVPDSTGEVNVRITPFDEEGGESHTWIARVMSGSEVVSEIAFTTKVDASEVEQTAFAGDSLKTILAVIFGILVVVLIVLALIIAFRKATPNDSDSEPHSVLSEGQTYYYHPKK